MKTRLAIGIDELEAGTRMIEDMQRSAETSLEEKPECSIGKASYKTKSINTWCTDNRKNFNAELKCNKGIDEEVAFRNKNITVLEMRPDLILFDPDHNSDPLQVSNC